MAVDTARARGRGKRGEGRELSGGAFGEKFSLSCEEVKNGVRPLDHKSAARYSSAEYRE